MDNRDERFLDLVTGRKELDPLPDSDEIMYFLRKLKGSSNIVCHAELQEYMTKLGLEESMKIASSPEWDEAVEPFFGQPDSFFDKIRNAIDRIQEITKEMKEKEEENRVIKTYPSLQEEIKKWGERS